MFGWIKRAFDWTTGKIDSTVAAWVNTVVSGVWSFLASLFGDVRDAWNTYWAAMRGFSSGIGALGSSTYHWILWWLHVYWREWINWFRVHVESPLATAYRWVTHEGATVWHYLTHAADLADFLWDALIAKLESEAWNVGGKLGRFMLSLIVKNVVRFAGLIEDIADAVF